MGKKRRSRLPVARQRSRTRPGWKSVYLLWHTDTTGDEKLVGVYEKRANASSAINRMKAKPGFSEKGGAFEIASYQLNKDQWATALLSTMVTAFPHGSGPA